MTLTNLVWNAVLRQLLKTGKFRIEELPFDESQRADVRRVLLEIEDLGWLRRTHPESDAWQSGRMAESHLRIPTKHIRRSQSKNTKFLPNLYWTEVGVEGVQPALSGDDKSEGGKRCLIDEIEQYVQEGLLGVYRYEIDTKNIPQKEIEFYKKRVKKEDDNPGGPSHQRLMAIACSHIVRAFNCAPLIGDTYPGTRMKFDVSDEYNLLPIEAGEYWESPKVHSLLQVHEFERGSSYNPPTPNGLGRVAFVPYPTPKSAARNLGFNPTVYVITKEWMKRL